MFDDFQLTLAMTHACNLRCHYCYAGRKFDRALPVDAGRKAVDRAAASVAPEGTLEIGFFGGEPLLEAGRILDLMRYAREHAGRKTVFRMTTNGTVVTPRAIELMEQPDLEIAVSCDGLPEIHDRHRRRADGTGSFNLVFPTLRRLIDTGRDPNVVMVVRPDTMESLPEGLSFLFDLGVRRIEPAIDVWTRWRPDDVVALPAIVRRCAQVWRARLRDCSVGWFDEKVAHLAGGCASRCRFGRGQVAVAPSGRLYPCERLIGEDAPDNPMAMAGNIWDGEAFLDGPKHPARSHAACGACAMATACNTDCRCNNYLRTGRVDRPDRLLCVWNQACLKETAAAFTFFQESAYEQGPVPRAV